MNLETFISKVKSFLGTYVFINKLESKGERVDINLNEKINFNNLDMYQKSHFKRYEFASKIINKEDVCGDFACGTGYGTVMLAEKAKNVIGIDLNETVITEISKRYQNRTNVSYLNLNLLSINYTNEFDKIISFETIEHFEESNIIKLLTLYYKALKPGGKLIFSTPYLQLESEKAKKLGFHLTFNIDEAKIESWVKNIGFKIIEYKYQNYQDHELKSEMEKKEFIICVIVKALN